jgi:predicted ATPase
MHVDAFAGAAWRHPRHRTLEAAIAWSYDLLSPLEAITLQRLSVFADCFSIDHACQVIAYGQLDARAARLAIITLSQKSLLICRTDREPADYRLLDTTRHFATTRLGSAQDRAALAHSHARFLLHRLREVEPTILSLAGGQGRHRNWSRMCGRRSNGPGATGMRSILQSISPWREKASG